MNKSELIDAIAEKGEYLRLMQARHYDVIIGTITEVTFKKGDTVTLVGFVFSVKERAARTGRNP